MTEYRFMEIALRRLLIEMEVISQAELNALYLKMDDRGPHSGAAMIVKAWTDPEHYTLMMQDATEAARALGMDPTWLNLIVIENTEK